MEKPSSYSTALVQTSTLNSLLLSFDDNPRIVDFEATDQIASTYTEFFSYSPSVQPIRILGFSSTILTHVSLKCGFMCFLALLI